MRITCLAAIVAAVTLVSDTPASAGLFHHKNRTQVTVTTRYAQVQVAAPALAPAPACSVGVCPTPQAPAKALPQAVVPSKVSPQAVAPVYQAVQTVTYQTSGDAHGFCAWLNGQRARRGLRAVVVDAQLCNDAYTNSTYGFGHRFMGSARRQNAGVGALVTVETMWLASPGHAAALFDPTITRIGLGQVGSVITFSAN
jgi:uncharacterized protein YkwD